MNSRSGAERTTKVRQLPGDRFPVLRPSLQTVWWPVGSYPDQSGARETVEDTPAVNGRRKERSHRNTPPPARQPAWSARVAPHRLDCTKWAPRSSRGLRHIARPDDIAAKQALPTSIRPRVDRQLQGYVHTLDGLFGGHGFSAPLNHPTAAMWRRAR